MFWFPFREAEISFKFEQDTGQLHKMTAQHKSTKVWILEWIWEASREAKGHSRFENRVTFSLELEFFSPKCSWFFNRSSAEANFPRFHFWTGISLYSKTLDLFYILLSLIKNYFFPKTDQKKCISMNLASLLILLTQKLKVSPCWLPHSGNTCAPHAQFLFMSNCMASCSGEPTQPFPFGICTPSPSLDEDPVVSENSAAVCPNR